MTSEKMNQLMLQRNETSTRLPYMPPSLSLIACRNHCWSTNAQVTNPASSTHLPQSWPLTHWLAPKMMSSRPNAAAAGWRDGAGTK